MRAAVTEAPRTMSVRDDAREPGAPGPGEVVVRPEAIGICGSDFHFYSGELHELVGATLPRVQGHEVAAVVEAVGPDCRDELVPGRRVALWPLSPCGECRPCRMGRGNVCERFSLIGIHTDGGLQERLTMPDGQVFPIDVERPEVAALAEPVSIAVRAVNRGRVAAGERAVVLGAGPIGQAISVAALERGAAVLLVDPLERRLETGRRAGADAIPWTGAEEVVGLAREWAGDSGPPVVLDATGRTRWPFASAASPRRSSTCSAPASARRPSSPRRSASSSATPTASPPSSRTSSPSTARPRRSPSRWRTPPTS
jgi:threonine dehydrogenase-like Zn-dependent dehydrogenase